jgi:hypothetical protein
MQDGNLGKGVTNMVSSVNASANIVDIVIISNLPLPV